MMTQFKGTPGPWSGKDVGICKQDRVGLQLGFIMTTNTARVEECAANAHLIAAAPELLEALQSVIEACSNLGYNGDGQEELYIEVEKAEKVINKALGQ